MGSLLCVSFFCASFPPLWIRRDLDLLPMIFYDYFYGYLFSACGGGGDKRPLSLGFVIYFFLLAWTAQYALLDPTITTLDGHLITQNYTKIPRIYCLSCRLRRWLPQDSKLYTHTGKKKGKTRRFRMEVLVLSCAASWVLYVQVCI